MSIIVNISITYCLDAIKAVSRAENDGIGLKKVVRVLESHWFYFPQNSVHFVGSKWSEYDVLHSSIWWIYKRKPLFLSQWAIPLLWALYDASGLGSFISSFSALMLLIAWQEGHPACKNFLLRLYQNQGRNWLTRVSWKMAVKRCVCVLGLFTVYLDNFCWRWPNVLLVS